MYMCVWNTAVFCQAGLMPSGYRYQKNRLAVLPVKQPVPDSLRRQIPPIIRVLIILSTMIFMLQSFVYQRALQESRMRAKSRVSFYPRAAPGLTYDAVPEYAKKVFQDSPNLASQVLDYTQYGKATAIARFKSTFPKYKVTKLKTPRVKLFKHPGIFDTNYNGNISVHHINKMSYYRASSKYLYTISAILKDKSPIIKRHHNKTSKPKTIRKIPNVAEQEIVFTGWVQEQLCNSTLLCCFLSDNASVISFDNMKRLIWTQVVKQDLLAAKVFCPIPPDIGRKGVLGAALSLPREHCRKESFMSIEKVSAGGEDSVAICAKIIYGSFKADRLVEWLEIQKHIDVDKVFLYVYNLDYRTVEVVKHYTREGFVEMIPFDYPLASEMERYVGQKTAMAYIDEQVVVFDCMERIRGYTYGAIMDADEILYAKSIPKHGLKSLMKKLVKQFPLAGGFTFKTEIFITDWTTNNQSDTNLFWHTKHQNRTRPMIDRPKSFLKIDRVVLGSVWTHNFTTKPGFKRYVVPSHVAVVKHYRPCRENWGCDTRQGYIDKSIVRIAKNIKDKIFDKFTQLRIRRRTGSRASNSDSMEITTPGVDFDDIQINDDEWI